MNKFLPTTKQEIIRLYAHLRAFFNSDVRTVIALEVRLTKEVSDIRAEAAQAKEPAHHELESRLRKTLADHRDALVHLEMSKRTMLNLQGSKGRCSPVVR
jgi:hypothetical protein